MIIGKLIERQVIREGWSKTELAKQMSLSRGNLYNLFERSTIDSEMLFRLSVLLNYDFFKAYSERFERRSDTLQEPTVEYEKPKVSVKINMEMPEYLAKELNLSDFIDKNPDTVKYDLEK